MTARYAIYYAPAADSPLWRMASAWLGRDAVHGSVSPPIRLAEIADLDVVRLTADPRHYGFHATLKAPFELARGRTLVELLDAAEIFSTEQVAFQGAMAPAALDRFLAFRLSAGEDEMAELHAACVREFEPFRAPLSDDDVARRRKAGLTPEQDARMLAWGYPYVFSDFRFHMTLTGAIADDAVRQRVLGALQTHFAEVSGAHLFDAIAVFRQPDREAPFDLIARLPFGG